MATESIQPYTTARVNYLATYLQTLLPGLDKTVATTWITAERGVSGNVLGTTYTSSGSQHLYTYPSQEAGLRAAAGWINNNARYSGVKASLGSSASAQASALATSGWNNSYYPGVFASVISGHASTPSGGTSTPLTSSPSTTNPGTGSMYGVVLNGQPFTTADVQTMLSTLDKLNVFSDTNPLTGSGARVTTEQLLTAQVGQPKTAALATTLQGNFGSAATSAGNPLGGIIPDVQTAITFLAIILVGIAFIGVGGLIALRKK